MKKIIIILLLLFSYNVQSQIPKSKIPIYMTVDFFEKYPDFYKYEIGKKVKYSPPDPEILGKEPEFLNIISEDGIRSINISGSNWQDAQTETWIGINYKTPNNLIATCNDNYFLGGRDFWRMSSFYSTNFGQTWNVKPTVANLRAYFEPKNDKATIFDPTITFDTKGNAYYAYGFAETYYPDDYYARNKNGIFLVKSTNNGGSWDGFKHLGKSIVAITKNSFKEQENPFHDRYSITSDRSESSPFVDNLYIAWRVFGAYENAIALSRSTDAGETWSDYIKLADEGQHAMPITGPNGELYVVWLHYDFSGAVISKITKSTDGGITFGKIKDIQKINTCGSLNTELGRYVLENKQNMRVDAYPHIAVDNSNSAFRGSIYVVQAGRETSNGPYSLYLAYSRDGGESWTNNVRIDNNLLRNDIFMPSITVDPITGQIGVFYYSSQNDSKNIGADAYFALSRDGGVTWNHFRLTKEPASFEKSSSVMSQGPYGASYWGDYTSVVAYDGSFYPLFWLPTKDNNFTSNDLFVSIIKDGPMNPKNLKATLENQYQVNERIKLTWENPTKTYFGDLLGDFIVKIYRGNEEIGELTNSQAPEFIDNDIHYGIQTYKIQVVDKNNKKSELIEVNIDILGTYSYDPMPPTDLSWRPHPEGVLFTWKNPVNNIDGRLFKDSLKIYFFYNQSNLPLVDSVEVPKNQIGNYQTHLYKKSSEEFRNMRLNAIGIRGGQKLMSDHSYFTPFLGKLKTSLDLKFDSNQYVPLLSYGWDIRPKYDQWENKCMGTFPFYGKSGYEKNYVYSIILPPVVLSPGMTTLSFDHIALINSTPDKYNKSDFGEISISKDFGKSWIPIKWFDYKSSPNFNLDKPDSSKYDHVGINVAEHINDTLMFKFMLYSFDDPVGAGWYIDNIKLDDSPVNVRTQIEDNTIVNISPNPVSSEMKLHINLPIQSNLSWDLLNNIGEILSSQGSFLANDGLNTFNLNLSNYPNGIYYIRVKINNVYKTVPIIVAM